MSEFRPGRFQMLPLVIKNLLIINGLVFLAQVTLENMYGYTDLEDLFGLHYWGSELFKPHQLHHSPVHARRIRPRFLQHVCPVDVW